jgi:hypothetical protein
MSESEHLLELINAEIDGELTGPLRAELNRLLLADPAVRALRDELVSICRALDALPQEEVPADLHARIMASVPVVPERATARQSGFLRGLPLRYAAALAGGLLLTALAFQLNGVDPAAVGTDRLEGTIASANPASSRMDVQFDEIRGSIRVEGTPEAPIVRAELSGTGSASVVAQLGNEKVRLDRVTGSASEARVAHFSQAAGARQAEIEIMVIDDATSAVLQRGKLRIGDGD